MQQVQSCGVTLGMEGRGKTSLVAETFWVDTVEPLQHLAQGLGVQEMPIKGR